MEFRHPANLLTTHRYSNERSSITTHKHTHNGFRHHEPEYQVNWNGPDDSGNPLNWSPKKSWTVVLVCSFLVLNVAIASSGPEMTTPQYISQFGISREIADLNLSLFIAGYCAGPLAWGPLSETYGRRVVYLISCAGYILCCLACALSQNIATLLAFRFLSGTFAAAALSIAGAVIGDVIPTEKRGFGICIFSLTQIVGATSGPVIGGYIQSRRLNWRWVYWVCVIAAMCSWILLMRFLSESYEPLLLKKRAESKRNVTGDLRYWAELEKRERDWRSQVYNSLVKPFKMLMEEPLLLVITLYTSFLYGILYMMFGLLPVVVRDVHHLGPLQGGATFMAMPAGGAMVAFIYIVHYGPRYKRLFKLYAPSTFPPECRLGLSKVGAILFPISIFVLGWTNHKDTSMAFPVLAIGLMGMSIIGAFISLYDYLIETYLDCSATALSVNITLRSVVGSIFPMVSGTLVHNLGFNWTATLIGAFSVLGLPIPFLLEIYGPNLRKMSKTSSGTISDERKMTGRLVEITLPLKLAHGKTKGANSTGSEN